ncbi:hypothetical protein NEH16_18610 [Streptomyces drozdowiczii]|uniref:Transposase n=1 Tax=Streptomyces drozdowiczii TaxID=202862 RepID=A0ABY6PV02_9ACTN|nr:hypothetical protein [Streptomyces drozdowiczii]UZK55855.1 hypothetical protein NEH16_18610 [Streptomyces drozdowiczii]
MLLAREARGKSLATAATRLTLDYAFHVTSLRMVRLKALAPTRRASAPTRRPDSARPVLSATPATGSVRSATR